MKAGEKYDFSMFVRNVTEQKKDFIIQLTDSNNVVIAKAKLKTQGRDWQQYQAVLTAKKTCDKARLAIVGLKDARAGIDMVSLFPRRPSCTARTACARIWQRPLRP